MNTNPFYESFLSHASEAFAQATDAKGLKAVQAKASHELDGVFSRQLMQSGRPIACRAGCFYCCHLKVDVGPGEAFAIADYVRAKFSDAERADVVAKAQDYWRKTENLTLREQFAANLPCPLLRDNQCSVYPVRPMVCRIKHSTNVADCERSFKDPNDDLSSPGEEIPEVRISTAGALIGVRDGMRAAGFDAGAYDLAPALIEALTNPKAEKRWRDGKAAFAKNMRAKEPDVP